MDTRRPSFKALGSGFNQRGRRRSVRMAHQWRSLDRIHFGRMARLRAPASRRIRRVAAEPWWASTNALYQICLLTNNFANYGGGGIAFGTLNNSLVVLNVAAYGGGCLRGDFEQLHRPEQFHDRGEGGVERMKAVSARISRWGLTRTACRRQYD